MAGFSTELQRNVNLQLGSNDFGPFNIDDDVQSVDIEFARVQWTNPAARLDVAWECVIGAAVIMRGRITAFGGPAPVGKPNIVSDRLDLPPGSGRQIRGTYTVSGERIRTTITLRATV
jgi:hypothetical protein